MRTLHKQENKIMKLVSVINVSKIYHLGDTEVVGLNDVSFDITEGDFVVLSGPSGSGKSTLLHLLGCLDRPDKGQIIIDNVKITDFSLENLTSFRLNKMGFIFQSFNLIPIITAYENIELPMLFQLKSQKQIQERVEQVLSMVGLTHRMRHLPSKLSGGERQRVAIARALVCSPKLIIADEPTANLDSKTGKEILDFLYKLNKEQKITLVIASHNQNIIERGDVVYSMNDGCLTKLGK